MKKGHAHGTIIEMQEETVDRDRLNAIEALKTGCKTGEQVGHIFGAIITPRSHVRIHICVQDCFDKSKDFDKIFCVKANNSQRDIIILACQLAIASRPFKDDDIIVVQIDRNKEYLEITIFDVCKDDAHRIRAMIGHHFTFSIIEETGREDRVRIRTPRSFSC